MRPLGIAVSLLLISLQLASCTLDTGQESNSAFELKRGVCVVLGDADCALTLELARNTELLLYLQLESPEELDRASRVIDAEGFFGTRIFVEEGDFAQIHLADNLADRVLVIQDAVDRVSRPEVLRVLRPGGKAYLGDDALVKPLPAGLDDWSHPYHGPDNNHQSEDQVARAPYLTQFLAEPYYAPLTQVAVTSSGRLFKAFGNIAFHVREEPLLNSLVAFNGYNGTMLWRRKLTPGVMIHRNTMIATPEVLYVADDKSCKLIDTTSGRLLREIVPPVELAGGTFWKWMALDGGVLYALVGEQEQREPVTRQRRESHGWPWDPLSPGFNQPENPWGFGHNLLAIDPETQEVLWHHREKEKIDSRALCMKNGRIYVYRHSSYLACLDASNGGEIWRRTPQSAPDLFSALGPYLNRQDWRTNWRTTAYLKCSEKALYFAGPSLGKLLAVSAEDGSVLWENPYDNFQLVLREDGLYAISGQIDDHPSLKLEPLTGEVLASIDIRRRACTRPNGSADAVLFRAPGGSIRLETSSGSAQWVSPMRAQCQDGVTVSNGLLYWWPSVCDCQNTLYGLTCLGPAGDFEFGQEATESERLHMGTGELDEVVELSESNEWPTFRANNLGTATTDAVIPSEAGRLWWFSPETPFTPTAPVAAGGLAFVGGSDGIVRALELGTGKAKWTAYTGGFIRFPPTVWKGRLFVGSGDGWMYVFEAATGRLLWRFNAAPANRKIPVYGSLMSTWPVASGVLVEDGVAYFAAGIVNYDGVHVYALDAKTGKIVWQNNESGHLDPKSKTGVSVQGQLLIHDGKLYLAGGTSVSPAVYDLEDGRCLNDPEPLGLLGSTSIRGQELYLVGDKVVVSGKPMYAHPDHPVYDSTVFNKMLHTSGDRRDVVWVNNKRIMCFGPIGKDTLNRSVSDTPGTVTSRIAGWGRLDLRSEPFWEYVCEGSLAFARSKNAILVAGKTPLGSPSLEALDIKSGKRLWKRPMQLQGAPTPWGLAVDGQGRVVVTLTDGEIMCFGPEV